MPEEDWILTLAHGRRVKFTTQALPEDGHLSPRPQCTAQSKVSNFSIVVAGSGKKRARNWKGKAHRNSHSSHPCGYAREKGDRHADLDQVSAEELIAAPAMWCPNPADPSCLRVQGSSMSYLISNGDVVAVDRSQSGPGELSGKIVVPWHRDHGVSLSRFLLANDVQLLESENRDNRPDRNGKRPELETYRDGSLVDSQG
jgi:peptidase S24-like protein